MGEVSFFIKKIGRDFMTNNEVKKKSFFDKTMDFIEKVGNAMPDPVSLFIILAVLVVVLSFNCGHS